MRGDREEKEESVREKERAENEDRGMNRRRVLLLFPVAGTPEASKTFQSDTILMTITISSN